MDARIGDNNPPSQVEFAQSTADVLGEWLKIHPVVQTEDEAREYKLLRDRGKNCLKDMEDERKALVQPLQQREREINDKYRSPRTILERILGEGDNRLNAWIRQEEEKRRQEAEQIRQEIEQAKEVARLTEQAERSVVEEAAVGSEGDLVSATRDACLAQTRLQVLQREAQRADRATNVKVAGGFNRAYTTREQKTLVVVDPIAAISAMGWSERMLEALKTDAREYRRQRGQLPEGITERRS